MKNVLTGWDTDINGKSVLLRYQKGDPVIISKELFDREYGKIFMMSPDELRKFVADTASLGEFEKADVALSYIEAAEHEGILSHGASEKIRQTIDGGIETGPRGEQARIAISNRKEHMRAEIARLEYGKSIEADMKAYKDMVDAQDLNRNGLNDLYEEEVRRAWDQDLNGIHDSIDAAREAEIAAQRERDRDGDGIDDIEQQALEEAELAEERDRAFARAPYFKDSSIYISSGVGAAAIAEIAINGLTKDDAREFKGTLNSLDSQSLIELMQSYPDRTILHMIDEPSKELTAQALNINGLNIGGIESPSEAQQWFAVRENPEAIALIEKPSPIVERTAVEAMPQALALIQNPDARTVEAALEKDPAALAYTDKFMELTAEVMSRNKTSEQAFEEMHGEWMTEESLKNNSIEKICDSIRENPETYWFYDMACTTKVFDDMGYHDLQHGMVQVAGMTASVENIKITEKDTMTEIGAVTAAKIAPEIYRNTTSGAQKIYPAAEAVLNGKEVSAVIKGSEERKILGSYGVLESRAVPSHEISK